MQLIELTGQKIIHSHSKNCQSNLQLKDSHGEMNEK